MDDEKSVKNPSTAGLIKDYVNRKISSFQYGNPAKVKAELANLRRGAGKSLQETPELWGVMMEGMPEKLIGKGNQPSYAEQAVFLALTLFGLAQQSHETSDLQNRHDVSLGGAAGLYTQKVGEENSHILNRLKRVTAANSISEISVPLRALIDLLSKKEVQLDFGQLAADLYRMSYPESRDSVRLKWARDYFKNMHPAKEDETSNDGGEES